MKLLLIYLYMQEETLGVYAKNQNGGYLWRCVGTAWMGVKGGKAICHRMAFCVLEVELSEWFT